MDEFFECYTPQERNGVWLSEFDPFSQGTSVKSRSAAPFNSIFPLKFLKG